MRALSSPPVRAALVGEVESAVRAAREREPLKVEVLISSLVEVFLPERLATVALIDAGAPAVMRGIRHALNAQRRGTIAGRDDLDEEARAGQMHVDCIRACQRVGFGLRVLVRVRVRVSSGDSWRAWRVELRPSGDIELTEEVLDATGLQQRQEVVAYHAHLSAIHVHLPDVRHTRAVSHACTYR